METTAASQTFALRKKLQDELLASQLFEHKFYGCVALQVEQVSEDLAVMISKILQDSLPNWTENKLKEFSLYSQVPVEQLLDWKNNYFYAKESTEQHKQILTKLEASKVKLKNVSGLLWGAILK